MSLSPRLATFLVFIVNGAVVGTWLASIPGVRASLGASGTELGIILLFAAAGALVSQQVTGQLLVRFSSRHMVLATSAIFPLMTVLPLLAPTPVSLAVIMFAFGAFNTAMDVSMNHHGVALEESGGRSIFSGLHAGWSIGGMLGAVGVGVALSLGVDRVVEAVIAGLVLWTVALTAGRFIGPGSARTEDAAGISWPSRAVLPIAVLLALLALVEGGLSDWGGVYLQTGLDSSQEIAAFAYAALALGLTAGRFGGDRIKDRVGSVKLIEVGMLLCGLIIALMLLIAQPYVALLGMVAAGATMGNAIPQLFGAAGRIPPHGPSLSAGFTFLTLGFLVGPPLIGSATDAVGVGTALWLLVACALIVGVSVRRVPDAETNPRLRSRRPDVALSEPR